MGACRLSELEIGQTSEVMVYIVDCRHGQTKKQVPFAALAVRDASAQRHAKKWNLSPEDAAALCPRAVIRAVVRAEPPYNSGNSEPELHIQCFEPMPDADPAAFLPASPSDPDENWQRFSQLARSITQPDLGRLLRRLFKDVDVRTAFMGAPAAVKKHHAYRGGLLEHSVEVADLVLEACNRLGGLNRDLVLTGALIHDIGKIREMRWDQPGYAFTESGNLKGHVILGSDMVREAVLGLPDFDIDVSEALQHLVLSHHGRKEWGAPVEPATPEAVLLHSCDHLSVQMFYCRDAARNAMGESLQWVPNLERYMHLTPLPPDARERGGVDGTKETAWWEEEARPEIRIVSGGLPEEAAPPQMAAFPIYGCIAAGSAIRCEQNLEGYLALPLTGHGDAGDFLLRVTGDSMRDAHILDGDIVRVRPRAAEPREGDIVAALVNGDATVKRFHRQAGRVLLKAENPAYPDIPVAPSDDFSIQGVVVGLLRERVA